MRKVFHICFLCFVTVLFGCSNVVTKNTFNNTQNLILKPNSGFLLMAALIEMNTNFSSLIFDKTKAKFEDYRVSVSDKIVADSKIFVIPPKDISGEYDFEIKSLMENIISLNKLGTLAKSAEDADYIMILNFEESVTKIFGKNFIREEITVFNNHNAVISNATVTVFSNSDENFFYFQTRPARPVSYLKIKGLQYLIEKSFPEMFKFKKGGKNA